MKMKSKCKMLFLETIDCEIIWLHRSRRELFIELRKVFEENMIPFII